MPKPSQGKSQQGNILIASVLLIWLLIFLLGGGLALATATGLVNLPDILTPLPPIPTVPTLPGADSPPETSPPPTELPPLTPESALQTPPSHTPLPERTAPPTSTPESALQTLPSPSPTPLPIFVFPQNTFSEGPIIIGYSVAGRPIEAYRFGTGPVKRMIVAGIHGGYEWNTVALADELIEHIQANPDFIPRNTTLYIVRNLNPDGYARAKGIDGRVNNHNVDLNRNFPVNWQETWPINGCWSYRKVTAGSGPASEPETQALISFVSQTRPLAIISYHSAALGIFPGGEPPDPDSVRLAEALAEVSTYPYPPIDTGCLYTGTLPDWAVSIGIAAVDLELHNHVDTDFEENLKVITALLEWRR